MVGAFRSTFARTETSQLSLKTLDGGAIKGNRHINYDNTRFKREKYGNPHISIKILAENDKNYDCLAARLYDFSLLSFNLNF